MADDLTSPVSPAPPGDMPGSQPISSGFRPLGATNLPDGPALLQSLNGIVTNMVTAQRESQKITKEILAASERTARMMGTVIEQAQTLKLMHGRQGGDGVLDLDRGLISPSGLSYAHEEGRPPTPGMGVPAPAHEVVSRGAQQGHLREERAGGARGLSEGLATRGAQPAHEITPGFQMPRTWEEGKRFDLGSLRQNVAAGVNREVSEWGTGGKQYFRAAEDQLIDGVQVRKGQFLAARDASGATIPGTGSRPAPAGGPKTVGARLVRNEAGELIPEVVGNPGWRYQVSSVARNVAGSMAEGEGLGVALSNAAPAVGKALGVAGAVYVGANQALDFAESQRQRNMAFQSVLGGSNAEGFGERWRQNIFRLGLRGTMGGADAEAIYKAAMENYGTNREARGDYQSAAVSMFRGGIGSDESINLLNQAARQGNDNVKLLAESVLALGQVARSAGESAAEARQRFSDAMSSYSDLASGTQQIQLAAVDAGVQTALGDRLGNISYEGQNSNLGMRMIAQRMNVSPAKLSAALNSGGQRLMLNGKEVSGAQFYAAGKDELTNRAVSALDPNGQIKNAVIAEARRRGYSDKDFMDTAKMEEIAAEVQTQMPSDLVDPMRLGGVMRGMGLSDVSNNDAMLSVTQHILAPNLNQRMYESMNSPGDPSNRGFRGIGSEEAISGKGGYHWKENERSQAFKGFLDAEFGITSPDNFLAMNFPTGSKKNFLEEQSPEAQAKNVLLKQLQGGKGISDNQYALWKNRDELADARFVVQTADGERSVEFGELIKDYRQQLNRAPETIQVQGGRYGGSDLYSALGLSGNGMDFNSDDIKARNGVSVEEGRKRTKETGKSTGVVEIFLTDEAKRLIDVRTTGSARYARSYNEQPPSGASTPVEQSGN